MTKNCLKEVAHYKFRLRQFFLEITEEYYLKVKSYNRHDAVGWWHHAEMQLKPGQSDVISATDGLFMAMKQCTSIQLQVCVDRNALYYDDGTRRKKPAPCIWHSNARNEYALQK